jgi:hypothetical protein
MARARPRDRERHDEDHHRRQARRFPETLGISHPTKSRVEFGCIGKDGYFDEIKIWNAEPVK